MKITVEFNSMEEFFDHMRMTGPVDPQMQKMVEETAKIAPAEPLPADPVESAPVEEKAPEADESFRVEVRKTLAALNKKKTGNPAKALISETGFARLTDVPLELLPGLMAKAKEALGE